METLKAVVAMRAVAVIREEKEHCTGPDLGRSTRRRSPRKKKASGTPMTLPSPNPSRVMRGNIWTNGVQTKTSGWVVLPNGELKAFCAVVDIGCRALALSNCNVGADHDCEKMNPPNRGAYFKLTPRCLCQWGTSKEMSKFKLPELWL